MQFDASVWGLNASDGIGRLLKAGRESMELELAEMVVLLWPELDGGETDDLAINEKCALLTQWETAEKTPEDDHIQRISLVLGLPKSLLMDFRAAQPENQQEPASESALAGTLDPLPAALAELTPDDGIAKLLRVGRKALGLTRSEMVVRLWPKLAEENKGSKQIKKKCALLTEWERGEEVPGRKQLSKISDIFEMPIELVGQYRDVQREIWEEEYGYDDSYDSADVHSFSWRDYDAMSFVEKLRWQAEHDVTPLIGIAAVFVFALIVGGGLLINSCGSEDKIAPVASNSLVGEGGIRSFLMTSSDSLMILLTIDLNGRLNMGFRTGSKVAGNGEGRCEFSGNQSTRLTCSLFEKGTTKLVTTKHYQWDAKAARLKQEDTGKYYCGFREIDERKEAQLVADFVNGKPVMTQPDCGLTVTRELTKPNTVRQQCLSYCKRASDIYPKPKNCEACYKPNCAECVIQVSRTLEQGKYRQPWSARVAHCMVKAGLCFD